MPVVTITLMEGYDDAIKTRICERLSDAVSQTIAAPLDGITVVIHEVSPSGYMRGRQRRAPGAPVVGPAEIVADYLAAMEARDLDRARAHLAPGFQMTFPGGVRMTSLEELIAWAKPRYRHIRKSIERIDEGPDRDGAVVTCFGTLAGEWLDGAPFEGIRFIDRFTVRDSRLVDQMVWNDIGEYRAATR